MLQETLPDSPRSQSDEGRSIGTKLNNQAVGRMVIEGLSNSYDLAGSIARLVAESGT